jgi:hypothetical protein
VTTQTTALNHFNALKLDGIGEVTIQQTGQESITITTDDNYQDNVSFSVQNQTLEVATHNIVNPTELKLTISCSELSSLHVTGLTEVSLAGLEAERITVDLLEGGSILAEGKVGELILNVEGTSSFQGANLTVREASVAASDVSETVLEVTGSLDAATRDLATVIYFGSPSVTANTEAGGSVTSN